MPLEVTAHTICNLSWMGYSVREHTFVQQFYYVMTKCVVIIKDVALFNTINITVHEK
jgi:hypothetical protein